MDTAPYTLVELEDNRVIKKELIENPGHRPGFLPGFLARHGISCIIAGGMGLRAQELFAEQGIEPIVGVTGPGTGDCQLSVRQLAAR